MNNNSVIKGFTLVEIMIVVVIIGLLAALAVPAFNRVRLNSQEKAIQNNLRQIAAAADQYFILEGTTSAALTDLIGSDPTLYMKLVPQSVAGEAYTVLFPITIGFTSIAISKADGSSVTYDQ